MPKPRDYKKEYRDYHGKDKQIKARENRNKARRLMIKEGKVRKGDGKEVDHHDGNPMNNGRKNLRIMSRHANRKKA